MEANALVELQEADVVALNAAILRTKLLQIASGAVYGEANTTSLIDEGRYELVLDLIEQRKHSICFFNWTHQKEYLIREARKRKIMFAVIDSKTPARRRAEVVEAFQQGFYQTLFMHPKTGAHGLTLTKGTAVIWSSPIYEADLMKQGIHRIVRSGQTQTTETLLVCAKNTIEHYVYEVLRNKEAKMKNLLEMLQ